MSSDAEKLLTINLSQPVIVTSWKAIISRIILRVVAPETDPLTLHNLLSDPTYSFYYFVNRDRKRKPWKREQCYHRVCKHPNATFLHSSASWADCTPQGIATRKVWRRMGTFSRELFLVVNLKLFGPASSVEINIYISVCTKGGPRKALRVVFFRNYWEQWEDSVLVEFSGNNRSETWSIIV